MLRTVLLLVAVVVIAFASGDAKAGTIEFSISEDAADWPWIGRAFTPGKVTGVMSGLVDNASGQVPTSITFTSDVSALGMTGTSFSTFVVVVGGVSIAGGVVQPATSILINLNDPTVGGVQFRLNYETVTSQANVLHWNGGSGPVVGKGNRNGFAGATYSVLNGTLGAPPPTVTCSTSITAMQPWGGGLVNVGFSYSSSDPAATKTVAVYSNDNNLTSTSTSFFFNGSFYHPKPAAAQLFGTNLMLRADRYATPGRVYLIVVKATNANGTGFACSTVVVPFTSYFFAPPSSIATAAATAKAFCDANAGAPPSGPLPPAGSGYDTQLASTAIP